MKKKSYRLKKSPNEFGSFNDALIVYNEKSDTFVANITIRVKEKGGVKIKKISTKPQAGDRIEELIGKMKNDGYLIVS